MQHKLVGDVLMVKTDLHDWVEAEMFYGTEDSLKLMIITREIKYFESVRNSFNSFLKTLNEKFAQFELVKDSYKDYDCIYMMMLDGISIMWDGDRNFEVGYETYDSGSYWEPPSSDYVEYSQHKTIHGAFGDALGLYINNWYTQYTESQFDEFV